MILAFGDYRLDLDRRELRRGPDWIELQPQVFDLLAYLVRERDRVVSKDDLLQAVWGGRVVSDSALTTRIHAVRRALGDDGAAQRLIRTFTRKGFRFVGDVRETPERPAPVACRVEADPSALCPWLTLADAPSVAVLPFANLSGERKLDFFADGLVEEITIALFRIPWLCATARNSRFASKRQNAGTKRASGERGIRYLLEGSVRKDGNRVRITARLTEAETGVHLWSDHFGGSLEDACGLQDRVASRLAGAIEPVLQALEAARALRRPLSDLTAYHAYLRAFAMLLASARQIPAALALLEKAMARDPNYGPALGLAANCSMRLCMDQITKNPAADARKAADYAWRALQATADDPGVLANVARPLAYAGEDIGTAIALMDRALALNPSFARGWYIRGFLKYWAGDLDVAIEEVETAQRLSPRGRFGTALTAIGNALVFSRRFEEAASKLRIAVQQDPSFPPNYRLLAISYAHLGRLDEARAALARLPETAPLVIPNVARSYRAMFRIPEHRELALTGIQLVTGETT
jgi:TolB-like protein/DNA-binding winged helix-turn-helix (wHTH) protein